VNTLGEVLAFEMFGFGRRFKLEDGAGDAYPLDCGVGVFDMKFTVQFSLRKIGALPLWEFRQYKVYSNSDKHQAAVIRGEPP
jgi:hypothetical protein